MRCEFQFVPAGYPFDRLILFRALSLRFLRVKRLIDIYVSKS